MARLGILGGTFDPIHLGHTEPAKVVAEYLSLEQVLFVPANIPYHKESPNVNAKQRAKMVMLACESEENFHCDIRELERSGNTYTIDTLRELKKSYPDQSLFFIIGVDSLLTFTQWHQFEEILSLCHLVVNSRPNHPLINLNNETELLVKKHHLTDLTLLDTTQHGGIIFVPEINIPDNERSQYQLPKHHLEKIHLDISSSEIRTRIANKQKCQHLVTDSVLDFINKNQLYR